jgi:auxin response factor
LFVLVDGPSFYPILCSLSLMPFCFLSPDGSGCPDFAESAQFHKVLQGQELLGYRTHDSTAAAAAQQSKARNMQYIDARSCSNDVSNTFPGIPRLGARALLRSPGFSYHCSGFGESQRFQKVLQGQEVLSPYRGAQVDAIRTGGFHQRDGPLAPSVANKWHTQLNGCVYRGPQASLLLSQSSSPPSVLVFQQGMPQMSQFQYGNGHLDENGDDARSMFGHIEGIGRTEQMLRPSPHTVSGEVENGQLTLERLHSANVMGKDEPNNMEVRTNSCKIFGISLTEKVPARKEKDCGDVNYPSSFQSLKQQVPKSLGNSCATVSFCGLF